jgi:hypothetical protein
VSACRRFEKEALERLERGLPLDPHFERCPDCRTAGEEYRRLQERLEQSPSAAEPPDGWQDRVWQEIDDDVKPPGTNWKRYSLLAAAAAVVIFLVFNPEIVRRLMPLSKTIQIAIVPLQGQTLRTEGEAKLGDLLAIESRVGNNKYYELRVYRHDRELVLQCSDDPPCVLKWFGNVEASVKLDTIGTYQPVLLISDNPLPDPVPDLDDDARRAADSGAEVLLGKQIRIR